MKRACRLGPTRRSGRLHRSRGPCVRTDGSAPSEHAPPDTDAEADAEAEAEAEADKGPRAPHQNSVRGVNAEGTPSRPSTRIGS